MASRAIPASPGLRASRGWRVLYHRLRRAPASLVGGSIVLFFLLTALFGPYLAPYGPTDQNLAAMLQPPSLGHWFGTDLFGRDVFSRVLVGSRDIFVLCGSGTLGAVAVGVFVGLAAGYQGGLWDEGLMRLMDVLLAIPALLLAMLLLAVVGPSYGNVLLVIVVLYIPMVSRVVRSVVLELKTKDFVEAARLRGESSLYIMFAELLPNALPPLVVEAAARFSYSIFLVASLGFLGLGVQPPSPDWGLMVAEARDSYALAPWVLAAPAAAISLLVVGVSLFSDGLRRLLRPGVAGG